ncbi:M57 family metalloprotease [Lapidilactobacillus bayanensis]|uniref:M57 family metalloprotease n=1 Tax=Lapidilactobacillus bayanensis TaxID=2485998 RepID=UPI0013DE6187|nr:M57 family metalloprotease [Lapidilactobacillus bayanensis]
MKIKSGIALVILLAGGFYFYNREVTQPQIQSDTSTNSEVQTILLQVQNGLVTVKNKLAAILSGSSQHQQNQTPKTNSTSQASDADASSSSAIDSNSNEHGESESTSNSTSTTETTGVTPIESIVQGQRLANTYTYSFTSETPNNVRQVFLAAIATYNQTGLVKLTAGEETEDQNHVTISIYQKVSANAGTLELGEGGPKIVKKYNLFQSKTTNHATASVNTNYQAAIAKSVALHELGHALGMDHSSQLTSVMYPVDQGVTVLATEDLASLREIYR